MKPVSYTHLDVYKRQQMGLAGRRKVEKTFDRKIVIEKYLNEVKNLGCK